MNGVDLGPPQQQAIPQQNFDPLFLGAVKSQIQASDNQSERELSGEQLSVCQVI